MEKDNKGRGIIIAIVAVLILLIIALVVHSTVFKSVINVGDYVEIEKEKAPVVTIGDNNNWFIDGADTNITALAQKGETGDKGDAGLTPVITIGENGNWYLNGADTGLLANATDGAKGDKGNKGADGSDGINGIDAQDGEDGEDGLSIEQKTVAVLNTLLATEGVSAKNTLYDRFSVAGVDKKTIDRLASSDNFLYDYSANRFLVIDDIGCFTYVPENSAYTVGAFISADINLWQITKSELSDMFCNYLTDDFASASITVSTGLDAGSNTNVNEITYSRNSSDSAQNVIIRTNTFGTRLTVSGSADDTVTHYGYAGLVEVKRVAMSSYDEYGTIGRLYATDEDAVGHIDVKAGAVVYQIEQIGGTATKVSVDENATVYDINHEKVTEEIVESAERFTATSTFAVTDENATGETITAKVCVHECTEDVIDDVHVYEVCKTCGYTVIKVVTNKKTVTTVSDENVIIPKASYGADQVTLSAEEIESGEVLIEQLNGEYVEPAIEQTPVVTPTENKEDDHKHSFGQTSHTDATCVNNGETVYTCTCGASYTTVINALGHDFTSDTYKDNGDGTHSQKCTACDAYNTAVSHNLIYVDNGDGTHTHKCSICTYTETPEAHDTANTQNAGDCSKCDHCEHVCKIGDTHYYTLREAITAAGTTKTTIVMVNDATEIFSEENFTYSTSGTTTVRLYNPKYSGYKIISNADITLDLNGKEITGWDKDPEDIRAISTDVQTYWDNAYSSGRKVSYNCFDVQENAKFTVTDTSDNHDGSISISGTNYSYDSSVHVCSGGSFTLNGGFIINTQTGSNPVAVYFDKGTSAESVSYFNMTGGTIQGTSYGVFSSSSGGSANTLIATISGGNVYATGDGGKYVTCVYFNSLNTLTVTGGHIGGKVADDCATSRGVFIRYGTATVSGGTVTSYAATSNDCDSGPAVEVASEGPTINICGNAHIDGNAAYGVINGQGIINVSGNPTFTTSLKECSPWFISLSSVAGNLNISGGTFDAPETECQYFITDNNYLNPRPGNITGGKFYCNSIADSLPAGKIVVWNSESGYYELADGTYFGTINSVGYLTESELNTKKAEVEASLSDTQFLYDFGNNVYSTMSTSDIFAQVGTRYFIFTDVERAVDYAYTSGEVLKVINSNEWNDSIVINKSITVDVNGLYRSSAVCFTVSEGITLTIINTSSVVLYNQSQTYKKITTINYGTVVVQCVLRYQQKSASTGTYSAGTGYTVNDEKAYSSYTEAIFTVAE